MNSAEIEVAWRNFKAAAQTYCGVIASAGEIDDSETLYERLAPPLAELFAAGLQLPSVAPSLDEFEAIERSSERQREIFERLDRLTGSDDPYRTIFHPQEDEKPVEAALADDLAGIYEDVLPATQWDDRGHLNDLIFELRLAFQHHWGRHALEAMRVMYWRHHRYR